MSSNQAPRCQHIKTNGTQCGSPALKDKPFCYFHRHRPATWEFSRTCRDSFDPEFTLPLLEDAHAIQFAVRQVLELIMRHQIDRKDAGLALYALQIASSNLKRIEREMPQPEDVVTDPPVEPPNEAEEKRAAKLAAERAAAHARFEATFPLDPEPSKKSDDDLPPGTIQACAATISASKPQKLRTPVNFARGNHRNLAAARKSATIGFAPGGKCDAFTAVGVDAYGNGFGR